MQNISEIMEVKKMSEFATIPSRGSKYAAGFDLYSAYDTIVKAKWNAIVKTDISISIPINTYARIAPRSGLAVKNFIDVGAGVVDYDYRGNVGVVLFNHSNFDFEIKKGDRIAQLILERICMANILEVDELAATERGISGYGSSGV
jgi:dUTP pyrophosphatase